MHTHRNIQRETHIHTHTKAHIHSTHTHTQTCRHTQTCIHTQECTRTHIYMHTYTQTQSSHMHKHINGRIKKKKKKLSDSLETRVSAFCVSQSSITSLKSVVAVLRPMSLLNIKSIHPRSSGSCFTRCAHNAAFGMNQGPQVKLLFRIDLEE